VTPTWDTIAAWLTQHGKTLQNLQFGMTNADPSKNIPNFRATGVTPGAANTDFTFNHSLGYVPDTILMQDTDNGGVLYRSPVTAWTKTTVTLRCTTVSANYRVRVV
jgi:hypothetical protein